MRFHKLCQLGIRWKSKMNESKVQNEKKLLFELQNVSEKISDFISQGNFQSIAPLEKQRLKILESFHVKPSDSGVKILKNVYCNISFSYI